MLQVFQKTVPKFLLLAVFTDLTRTSHQTTSVVLKKKSNDEIHKIRNLELMKQIYIKDYLSERQNKA